MGAIWCFALNPPPGPTRISGANSWVDDFKTNLEMVRFDDGDLDYRIFDSVGQSGGRTKHFINHDHWMDDNSGGFTGGAMMRPNRSFRFEDGKLVIETDVAASIPEYEGEAWTEVDISLAPAPTGRIVDDLYGYGAFGGKWTFGCRLQPNRNPVCALYDDSGRTVFDGGRLWEISFFQQVGDTFGGGPWGDLGEYWRECDTNQMDLFCRDRFRLELEPNRFSLYVNGRLFFQQTVAAGEIIDGLPRGRMFPDAMLNGDLFVYMTDFQVRPSAPVYRFHWGRLAVNPGTPPSASPSFCFGAPQNTCAMEMPHR
ncbi:MAG TPA: hypothetical protein VI876_12770 [Dehalococcoidia bacterium]|nr:hypothetical protein [Dehalococcoidia bacterium]